MAVLVCGSGRWESNAFLLHGRSNVEEQLWSTCLEVLWRNCKHIPSLNPKPYTHDAAPHVRAKAKAVPTPAQDTAGGIWEQLELLDALCH